MAAKKLARNGRKRVEEIFDFDMNAKKLANLFQEKILNES